jgi:hypothetical protein
MLKAVLHGKAGRIEQDDNESVSWRKLFKSHEDLMTAAVFGRFSYLSPKVQNYLLQQWLNIKEDFSDFEHIEFWPTYQLNDGEEERNVEPDLVLNFKKCNLIIEVKPPEGGDQYLGQWRREIKSFLQSKEGTDKPLYFLAIGRVSKKDAKTWANSLMKEFTVGSEETSNNNYDEDTDEEILGTLKNISALKWQPVADSVIALEKLDIANIQDTRIIKDIIDAFELYNLKTSRFKWPALVNTLHKTKLSLEHTSLLNNKVNLLSNESVNSTSTAQEGYSWQSLFSKQNKHSPLNMELINQWKIVQK